MDFIMKQQVNLLNLTGKTLNLLSTVNGKQSYITLESMEIAPSTDAMSVKLFQTNGILTFVYSDVCNLPEPMKNTAYIVNPDILSVIGNSRNDLFSCLPDDTGNVYSLYRGKFNTMI